MPKNRLRYGTSVALAACFLIPTSASFAAPLDGPDNTQQSTQHKVSPAKPSLFDTGVDNSPEATVEETTDRVVVKFKDGVSNADKEDLLESVEKETVADSPDTLKTTSTGADVIEVEEKLDKQGQKEIVEKLKSDDSVEYAEADQIVKGGTASYTSRPNDPYFNSQWNIRDISANSAWATATGSGTTIGIVDTGITNHPDLNSKVVQGYDFVSTAAYSRDGNGRDSNPQDNGDWGAAGSNWHGSHVAGIAAAATNNWTGISGVAPNARIQPLRALGAGGDGYVSDMADAIAWGAGISVAGVPRNNTPAKVVNLSAAWPSNTCPTYLKSAIDQAHARNVPVVVASGNSGVNANYQSPANCLGAIVVGATVGNTVTGYSNWGAMVDVVAPGGAVGSNIISTINTGYYGPVAPSYGPLNGTSMAAPHVAGTIAMMKQRDPDLGVEKIRNILRSNGVNANGYVKIDANRAVKAVTPKNTNVAQIGGLTVKGGIKSHYERLGGSARFGNPVTNEQKTVGNGVVQSFSKNGQLTNFYWSQRTGTKFVELSKGIGNKFVSKGREKGYGMPSSDERKITNGAYQLFRNPTTGKTTKILWSSKTSSYAVEESTAIGKEFAKRGYEQRVGYPMTDEIRTSWGAYQKFKNYNTGKITTINWTPKGGISVR